jgi:hypothetical protein
MHPTRIVLVLLALLTSGDFAHAQLAEGPVDGVGLLDYCSAVEIVKQPAETRKVLGEKIYQEKLDKYYWCLGYVESTRDAALLVHATLETADKFGITLSGTAHEKQVVSAKLQIACFPPATTNDLVVALNRWLSGHEQRLRESRTVLAANAFASLFPCDQTIPDGQVKTLNPPSAR